MAKMSLASMILACFCLQLQTPIIFRYSEKELIYKYKAGISAHFHKLVDNNGG